LQKKNCRLRRRTGDSGSSSGQVREVFARELWSGIEDIGNQEASAACWKKKTGRGGGS